MTQTSTWQPIDTAPKDGTKFIARKGDFVRTVFYMPNNHQNAKTKYTLQVIMREDYYSAAGTYFVPTHWMHLSEQSEGIS